MDKQHSTSKESSNTPEQIVLNSVHIDKLTVNLREKPQLTPEQEVALKKIKNFSLRITIPAFFSLFLLFSFLLHSPHETGFDFFCDTIFFPLIPATVISPWVFFITVFIYAALTKQLHLVKFSRSQFSHRNGFDDFSKIQNEPYTSTSYDYFRDGPMSIKNFNDPTSVFWRQFHN